MFLYLNLLLAWAKYDLSNPVNEDITLYPKYSTDSIFLENLFFELSKNKDYYIVTGTKYFEIYAINEMNGKLTRDENFESSFMITPCCELN